MSIIALVLQAGAGSLTLDAVLSEIPHDSGALVAYLLLGSIVALTWYGSRRSVIERYARPPSTAIVEEEGEPAAELLTPPPSTRRVGRAREERDAHVSTR